MIKVKKIEYKKLTGHGVFLALIILLFSFSITSFSFAGSKITKEVLENGMTVIVKENPFNDIVAMQFLIGAGPMVETEEKSGITSFVQGLLTKGTKSLSAQEFAFQTESMGIDVGASTGSDYCEVSVDSTREFFDKAVEIAADVLMNARFDPEEIEKERTEILREFKTQEDSPFSVAFNLLNENMYKGHPYGRPDSVYIQSITDITRDDLIEFYKTYYVPNNMVLSVVGNLEAGEVFAKLRDAFRDFGRKDLPSKPDFSFRPSTSPQKFTKNKEVQTAIVLWGYLTPGIKDGDSLVLRVVDTILGGGMSSRLFVELRDKKGLAYQVGTSYSRRLDISPFVAYIATNPANIEEVLKGFSAEFERIKKELISKEELEAAKRKVIGRFDLNHERNSSQAYYLAYYEMAGLGYGYDTQYAEDITRVTAQDIMRVANKYFKNETVAVLTP